MNPLDLVKLTPLMELTTGRPEIVIGLIDGPVDINHPDLVSENIYEIPKRPQASCTQASSIACMHGTFVAGILCAERNSVAPAVCPKCTLQIRPIFIDTMGDNWQIPSTTSEVLTMAIIESIKSGARIINLSLSLAQPSSTDQRDLEEALDYAARHSVITVAAAGNQGTIGSTTITRHPWVIPVVACDLQGRSLDYSNLGNSIGRRGLMAPGESISSIGTEGKTHTLSGTSVAAPFVTGAIALLWSAFPSATAAEVKLAVTQVFANRRTTVIPPLLDVWAAYQTLAKAYI